MAATSAPGAGGSTTPTGWHGAGSLATLDAVAAPGGRSEGWTGSGLGSYSGNSSTATLTLDGPLNETAAFYPGFTITVSGSGSVSYAYPSAVGAVSSGSRTVYVPPGTTVELSEKPSSFLFYFEGWGGTLNGSQPRGAARLSGVSQVEATFAPDLAAILVVALMAAAAAVAAILFARRKKSRPPGPGQALPRPEIAATGLVHPLMRGGFRQNSSQAGQSMGPPGLGPGIFAVSSAGE